MLADFVKSIAEMATARREPKVVELPGHRFLLVQPDGSTEAFALPRKDVADNVADLEGFVALLGNHSVMLEGEPIVFIGAATSGIGVVAIRGFCDSEFRRDSVTLALNPSAALLAVQQMMQWQKPKDFVNAFRDKLFDCSEADLLTKLRAIDFRRKNDGTRSIQHGSESLGRSVEAVVQSRAGELPEFTRLVIPWYEHEDFDTRQELTVCLDLNATDEMMRLVPRGDSLALANQRALQSVKAIVCTALEQCLLSGDAVTVPVIIGSPGLMPASR